MSLTKIKRTLPVIYAGSVCIGSGRIEETVALGVTIDYDLTR